MSILCSICMRGGSKGLKNKAIKKIDKKPLFFYTLDIAKKTKLFDKIVISTDSPKIIKECKKYNQEVFFKRPASISKDFTINKTIFINVTASVTNAYNRENIFYFNRIKYERVNQLPIMPSLGTSINF